MLSPDHTGVVPELTRTRVAKSGNARTNTPVAAQWGASFPAPYYIAVVVNSTTSLSWYISQNGYIWWLIASATDPSLTVGSVGIGHNNDNGSFTLASAFGFLRIWNSAKTILG